MSACSRSSASRSTMSSKSFPLSFQDAFQALLDCIPADEAVFAHRPSLADPVDPVARLVVRGRVPPLVEQEYMVRLGERQAFAADACRGEQRGRPFVRAKPLEGALAFVGVHFTDEQQTGALAPAFRHPPAEFVERFQPVGKDDGFLSFVADAGEPPQDSISLAALVGVRIEIADREEPREQRQFFTGRAVLPQRAPVGAFLSGGEFQVFRRLADEGGVDPGLPVSAVANMNSRARLRSEAGSRASDGENRVGWTSASSVAKSSGARSSGRAADRPETAWAATAPGRR